jgi:hypothetical protein
MPPRSCVASIFLVLAVIAVLSGCCGRATEPLPDADIVFQAATDDARPYRLGFVQADGTDLQYIEIRPYSYFGGAPICPVQTSDGDLLVFYGSRGATDPLSAITSEGHPIKYEDHYSGSGSIVAPVQGSHQAVIAEAYTGGQAKEVKHRIQLLDLDEGLAVQTYLTTTGVSLNVGSNALHETSLVYQRIRQQEGSTAELVLLSTETEQETILLNKEGMLSSPAIAPDGLLVAYTAGDGIHIVGVDGEEPRRVVEACVEWTQEGDGSRWWDSWPPAASWSPDGQWLIYHRCTLPCSQRCRNVKDYSIFKINLETGEEKLLVEGGLNPYWRLGSSAARP